MKNFITRTLTSILFVAVLVGCILYGRHSFGGLFVLITALSVAEFCRIVNAREGVQVNAVITTISGALLFMAFYLYASGSCDAAIFFPYLLSLLYLLVSELYLKQENPLNNWAYAFMAQLYVALPFALLNVLYFQTDPAHPTFVVEHWNVPLAVFCFLWASDAGAYCVGSVLGRYFPARLFPRISPKKSWVGSIGGGLLAMAVAAVFHHFDPMFSLPAWMGFGLVVTVFGTWGDLVESLIKRTLGIKDSGHVLPGHGGMLDRFDSSLLAIPASVVYLHLVQMYGC